MDDVIFYTQMRNILRYLESKNLDGGIPKKIKHRLTHEVSKRLAKSKLKDVSTPDELAYIEANFPFVEHN